MGCGKTTIGKLLAEKLSFLFFDTDELIEKRLSMKITEIFERKGENFFREIEHLVLREIVPMEKVIISTGGGIVEKKENRELMKKCGTILYLYLPFTDFKKKIPSLKNTRPLLQQKSMEEIERLYRKREEIYRKLANYSVNVSNKNPEEIVGEIVCFLSRISQG